jgi:Holliday junction resolvase RusA-like endonuclease
MRVSAALERKILESSLSPPQAVNHGLQGPRVWELRLTLPWPPTGNNVYPTVGKRRVLSSEGRAYHDAVGFYAAQNRLGHVEGSLALEVHLYPPDGRRRDSCNVLKVLEDSLVKARLLGDDSQIEVHRLERRGVCPPGRLEVWLWELEEQP